MPYFSSPPEKLSASKPSLGLILIAVNNFAQISSKCFINKLGSGLKITNMKFLFIFFVLTDLSLAQATIESEGLAPSASTLRFSFFATGTQNYICNTGTWKLATPDAKLFKDQKAITDIVGIHQFGADGLPFWRLNDGSEFVGNKSKAVTVDATAVPWLLLDFVSSSGQLKDITNVVRGDTTGGLAPTTACQAGDEENVPYTALYSFFGNDADLVCIYLNIRMGIEWGRVRIFDKSCCKPSAKWAEGFKMIADKIVYEI